MHRLLLLASLLIHVGTYAQKTQIYYLSGRPMSIATNNALMISAAEWNITFDYVNDAMLERLGMNEINRRNELASTYISKNTDLGTDWLAKIYELAALEEQRHTLFRSWIQQDEVYQNLSTILFEPIILFTKKKTLFGEHYEAFVVGQRITDQSRTFSTHAGYKISLKKARIKSFKAKTDLPFTLPQNGIQ